MSDAKALYVPAENTVIVMLRVEASACESANTCNRLFDGTKMTETHNSVPELDTNQLA